MNYVIMDLEWNQPLSHQSFAYRQVGDRLMFELLQIGAVKLDGARRMRGSFSQLIAPSRYKKVHPRVSRITGIRQGDLIGAPGFVSAMRRFIDWCGEDCVLLTWGGDDINVLKQNLDFFGVKDAMPPVYDLQKHYVTWAGEDAHRKGLQSAMRHCGIRAVADHDFHNAVSDAYYTAQVFQCAPNPEGVSQFVQEARPLVPRIKKHEDSLSFAVRSVETGLRSRHAMRPACPVCGKSARVPEGYVPLRESYVALADCPEHGLIMSELAFERAGNHWQMKRHCKLSDEQSPAYVKTKHLQWQAKVEAFARSQKGSA